MAREGERDNRYEASRLRGTGAECLCGYGGCGGFGGGGGALLVRSPAVYLWRVPGVLRDSSRMPRPVCVRLSARLTRNALCSFVGTPNVLSNRVAQAPVVSADTVDVRDSEEGVEETAFFTACDL